MSGYARADGWCPQNSVDLTRLPSSELLGADPELGSSVLGDTTGSDAPATTAGLTALADRKRSAGRRGPPNARFRP
jgi:hypothetical protein